MADVAGRSKVVISTVGPYLQYGEPLVAACAAAGADYVDLTGEAEFVDRMWTAHHATAVESGARIVHACGFDSIPYDLGAYFTVQRLPDDEPITMRGVVRSGGTVSGATFQTALEGMSRVREARAARAARRKAEARPEGRSSRSVAGKPHRDPVLGYWLLPLPTIDPIIVARSGAALATYGPEFRYSHFAGTKTLRYAVGGAAFVSTIGLAAQVKPLRELIMSRVPAGTGPDEQRRAKSWFTVDLVAEQGDDLLHTRVSGGDPGYGETAKMISESALCLAFDDNPPTAGQVTTAQAMGDHLDHAPPGSGHALRGDRVTPDPDDVVALVDFLRQRLDEDVAAARRSMTGSWSVGAAERRRLASCSRPRRRGRAPRPARRRRRDGARGAHGVRRHRPPPPRVVVLRPPGLPARVGLRGARRLTRHASS